MRLSQVNAATANVKVLLGLPVTAVWKWHDIIRGLGRDMECIMCVSIFSEAVHRVVILVVLASPPLRGVCATPSRPVIVRKEGGK